VTLRQIDVSADDVASGNTYAFATMLGPDLEPDMARRLQGTLIFMFPELEVEDKSIFEIPGIADYIALLHERIPHLVYFLQPSAEIGAIEGLMLALLPSRQRAEAVEGTEVPLTDELLRALAERLVMCATYATSKGDDWEPIVERFVEPLGDRARVLLVQVVRKATA